MDVDGISWILMGFQLDLMQSMNDMMDFAQGF